MKFIIQTDEKLSNLEKIIAKIRAVLQKLYSIDRDMIPDVMHIDLDAENKHNTSDASDASDSDYVPDLKSETESESELSESSNDYNEMDEGSDSE